ncbi:MAG: hypothetical protein WC465_02700 [Patescibacteria group bacterium]
MADFNQANAQVIDRDWLDDLLIKEPSGRLHSFRQSSPSDEFKVAFPKGSAAVKPLQDFDVPMPPSIYVAPADDSFNWQTIVGHPQAKASLVFHPDDEEHLSQIMPNVPIDESKKYSLDKIVARLIAKQQLSLDQANKELLTNVLFDFFRNRKNSQTAREYLAGKLLLAGQPISVGDLDTILSVVKSIKANIEAVGGLVVKDDFLTSSSQFKPVEPVAKTDLPTVPEPPKIEPAELSPQKTIEPEPKLSPKVEAPTLAVKIEADLPKVNRPPVDQEVKPKISDVKNKPIATAARSAPASKVLVGPVQELESMTLANFRRLGASAVDRAEKIHSKISILEKDSITKKSLGIAAWRKSPVYRLYLDLGAASLVQNKEIATLVQEQANQGVATLSWEEFNAIGDLNKLLRF